MLSLPARAKEALRPYYLRWLYFRLHPGKRPSYFADCWKYPPGEIGQGRVFLFLPMTDWHTRIQRSQHLAKALAAVGQACLYINPHLGREFPQAPGFGAATDVRALERSIAELHVRLPREPVFHHRMLERSETDRLVSAIETAVRGREAVQIVSFPIWRPVAEELRRRHGYPIVYDCHDVLAGFDNVAREIVTAERSAVEGSDLAVFSSKLLLEEHGGKGLLLRNAVDEAWVAQAENAEPTFVDYIGALDHWFDADALAHAAASLPGVRFRLIGRVEDERIRSQLASFRQIEFLGEVPHAGLPRYLRESRVGLIPFLRNKLTMGTNPIKLYEYFAYGLPVVASRLPEIVEYEQLVRMYETPEEFTEGLRMALNEDGSLHEARRAVARAETWSARASALLAETAPLFRGL